MLGPSSVNPETGDQRPETGREASPPAPVMQLQGLRRTYRGAGGHSLRVLRGVDLTLREGKTLALVGESGCGKSTLARCALLLEPLDGGRVLLDGEEVARAGRRALARFRRQTQLIFQDPLASLDPRMTVAASVSEPMAVQGTGGEEDVPPLLEQVGLDPDLAARLPHQLSGGQRQRVAIARALAARARVIVADEPASSLDLPNRAHVFDLLTRLQRERGFALLLITHDLPGAAQLADEAAVMYLGRVVERGQAGAVLGRPRHPYSQALVAAAPALPATGAASLGEPLPGEPPAPSDLPQGCPFQPRCALYAEREDAACRQREPELLPPGGGRRVACHEV